MKKSHGISLVCSLCGKSFTSMTGYCSHQKQHRGLAVCDICGKAAQSRAHLKRHMLTHSNATFYPCTACSSSFKHSFTLNRHLKTCPSFSRMTTVSGTADYEEL